MPPATAQLQAALSEQVLRSYAPATVPGYLRHWHAFSRFLRHFSLPCDRPVPSEHVAYYAAWLSQQGKSVGHARAVLAAIAWFHKVEGLVDPTKSFAISRLLLAMKKRADPARSKKALTKDLLHCMVRVCPLLFDPYLATLMRAAWLFAYYGCLRAGELCKSKTLAHTLKVEDVFLGSNPVDRVQFTLRSYKFSKEGKTCVVHKAATPELCLVRALLDYLQVRPQEQGPLFLVQSGAPLTRALLSKSLKEALQASGVPSHDYDTHSFRAGRATDLAAAGASETLIRETGRWQSNAFLKYLRFDIFSLPS